MHILPIIGIITHKTQALTLILTLNRTSVFPISGNSEVVPNTYITNYRNYQP